ncbi:hypothetical protein [Actinomycetospora chibensis]|uniref:Uncharacterized protein n=1 Tax=Actinomycetospora chibensis TaxID=663606 RepID=A0ABV9RMW9_9PSEU|nr:hypothetical protein [Actinomycetospora chibensis]MDD7924304.1 hypothetical protein [Actinomycetospora chibensis]
MFDVPVAGAAWTPSKLADWVECRVLFGTDPFLTRATLRDEIEEDPGTDDMVEFDVDDFDDDEDGEASHPDFALGAVGRLRSAEGVSPADQLSSDAFEVLEERSRIVGPGYPFTVASDRLTRRPDDWKGAPAYSFMLALNARVVYGLDVEFNNAARTFERLVVPAMASFVAGEAERIGWPRDPEKVEKAFGKNLRRIVGIIGERLNLAPERIPARIKDNGVDVIAWRTFKDKRRGQLTVLAQCAIGNEWRDKGVVLEKWAPYVHFAVRPITVATFPFVPDAMSEMDEQEFEYLSASVGLWFDRLRLAAHLNDDELESSLKDEIVSYVEQVLSATTIETAAGSGAA